MATTQRRAPLPITNLPVNALTDDVDPTRDLRALIDQLQVSARDSRKQTRVAEEERDHLAGQLDSALSEIEQLRDNERGFREKFIEISALLRERDDAVEQAARAQTTGAETQRRLETASRERDDAQRQRDDLAKRHGEAIASNQQALTQLGAVQKQVISIRQARDSAQALNLDLSSKVAHAEDVIADLEYQNEAAKKAQDTLGNELSEVRRQLGATESDRDSTAKQAQELGGCLDEARRKILDLSEQKTAVLESDTQHTAALAEARQQVIEITTERDAARQRAQEQAKDLEDLRAQIASLRDELTATGVATEALDDSKRQITALICERDLQVGRAQQLAQETAEQQQRLSQFTDELSAAQREREEAHAALRASREKVEQALAERDALREQNAEDLVANEAQLAALRHQAEDFEAALAAAVAQNDVLAAKTDAALQLAERFESQRVETIDLGARLEAAQREILELSANLAEARLAAKYASGRAAKAAAAAMRAPAIPGMDPGEFIAPLPLPEAPQPAPLDAELHEPLSEKEAKSALNAMRRCFQSFQKNPSDLSLLNELYSHAYGFSERARVSGYVALHRLSSAFARLAHDLYEYPETLNPSTMRTVSQTVDFLIVLMKDRNVAQIKDPAKAHIFAVDDDAENCDSIKMAMEASMMQTTCAQEPAMALAEIASGHFDLIFLDINLPGMDGFELCAHVRELPSHTKTPIVFLTGMTTLENRVQSSLSGANDFVGKPFNLHELSVKALTLVLKGQLQMD